MMIKKTFELVMVDARLAHELLALNKDNFRTINPSYVAQLAADMAGGRWKGPTLISISAKRGLDDGQHRLAAVIEADAATPGFKAPFYIDRDADHRMVYDLGKPRTAANYNRHLDYVNSRIAAIRLARELASGEGLLRLTVPQLTECLKAWGPDLERTKRFFADAPYNRPVIWAPVMILRPSEKFCEQIRWGEQLTRTDPAWVIRNYLLRGNSARRLKERSEVARKVFSILLAVRRGQSRSKWHPATSREIRAAIGDRELFLPAVSRPTEEPSAKTILKKSVA